MALYEHVILVRQDVTAQQVEAINEQFKGVIEANGGKVTKVEYWGSEDPRLPDQEKPESAFHAFSMLMLRTPPSRKSSVSKRSAKT